MSEQHDSGHEYGAAERNGHMEDVTVQTVQAPGARKSMQANIYRGILGQTRNTV